MLCVNFFFLMLRLSPRSTLFPYTTLFRSGRAAPTRARSSAGSPTENREAPRSEEHTSELQSLRHLVCRLLHEKKKALRRTITSIKILCQHQFSTMTLEQVINYIKGIKNAI